MDPLIAVLLANMLCLMHTCCCGVGDRLDAGDMETSRPGLGLESW